MLLTSNLAVTILSKHTTTKMSTTLTGYIASKYFDAVHDHRKLKDGLVKDVLSITPPEILNRKNHIYSVELLENQYFKDILSIFNTEELYHLIQDNVEHFKEKAPLIRDIVDKKHQSMYEEFKELSPDFVN